jgi:hypothetical protein
MTDIQKLRIEQKRLEFEQNKKTYLSYGSERVCSFKVLYSPTDKSITIVSNLIEDVTEENIPFTKQVFYNVVEDGSMVTMNLIMTNDAIAHYIFNLQEL